MQQRKVVDIGPMVLVGMGGVGKTQLAVEYAHAHRDTYGGGAYWLNASNPLLEELATLARVLGVADRAVSLERAAREAWQYLDERESALVVCDHVRDPGEFDTPLLPGLTLASLRCHLLSTSRRRDIPAPFEAFEVALPSQAEALRLLLRGRPDVLGERHAELGDARVICDMLGRLPLALHLAGECLARHADVSVAGLRERLEADAGADVLEETLPLQGESPTGHPSSVHATLNEQWSRVTSADARTLLRAAGQLPVRAWIPIARLGLMTGIPPESASRWSAIGELSDLSLLEEQVGERIRLHPLVHAFLSRLSGVDARATLGEHLARALWDARVLESQVVLRGVDPVLEDVRAAQSLLAGVDSESARRLGQLERVLDLETAALREWEQSAPPTFILQQLAKCARSLEMTELAEQCGHALRDTGRL